MGNLIASRNFQFEYVRLDQRRGPHSGAACGLRLKLANFPFRTVPNGLMMAAIEILVNYYLNSRPYVSLSSLLEDDH